MNTTSSSSFALMLSLLVFVLYLRVLLKGGCIAVDEESVMTIRKLLVCFIV